MKEEIYIHNNDNFHVCVGLRAYRAFPKIFGNFFVTDFVKCVYSMGVRECANAVTGAHVDGVRTRRFFNTFSSVNPLNNMLLFPFALFLCPKCDNKTRTHTHRIE